MSGEIYTDNRFEIIAAYKKKLIKGTNIESSPEEMAVIDNVLFRFWQMGWLPPMPHGRLGDLDELAKVVLNWITTQEKAYPNEDSNALSWRLGARAMGHQIYRDIEAAPTILPAEEGK